MNMGFEQEQDDTPEMEDSLEFRSDRHRLSGPVALQDEAACRCKALIEALARLNTLDERVDRFMTDILETGGSWHVSGPGEILPGMALVEVQLHGVRALGREIGQAIANWTAAARRAIEEQGGPL